MQNFFVENFSEHAALAVFLVALFPMVESRTAIPLGLSRQIWGSATLSASKVCLISFVGTMLPAFFVIMFARFIKKHTSVIVFDRFSRFVQNRIKKKSERFDEKENTLKKCLFLVGFVSVPLPLTGVYTGCLIAGFSNLKIWQSFLSILLGEAISCVGMTLVCVFCKDTTFYLFVFSIIVGFVLLLSGFAVKAFRKLTGQHKK